MRRGQRSITGGRKNGQAALILITAELEQISLHLRPRLNNSSLPIRLPRSKSGGRETGGHLDLLLEPSCLLLPLVAELLSLLLPEIIEKWMLQITKRSILPVVLSETP